MTDELNVDLAAVYGIELLNANGQLARSKNLVLENTTTGRRPKLILAT